MKSLTNNSLHLLLALAVSSQANLHAQSTAADSCATPDVIVGVGTFVLDTTTATTGTEASFPAPCGPGGPAIIWMEDMWEVWTAPSTGTAMIDTNGSSFDTVLGVYAGAGCPVSGPLACDDNSCGLQSIVSLPVITGASYMVRVGGGALGQHGPAQLHVSIGGSTGDLHNDLISDYYLTHTPTMNTPPTSGEALTILNDIGQLAVARGLDPVAVQQALVTFAPELRCLGPLSQLPTWPVPPPVTWYYVPMDTGFNYFVAGIEAVCGPNVGSAIRDVNDYSNNSAPTPLELITFIHQRFSAQSWTPVEQLSVSTFLDVADHSYDLWFQPGLFALKPGSDVIIADAVGALHGLILGPVMSIIEGAVVSVLVNEGALRTAPPAAPATAYCFGDGSGTACPCANSGAVGNGCANSLNPNGANLTATGSASVAADTLTLSVTGIPNGPGLYFQGTTQLSGGNGVPFGDGLRCVGGSILRLGVVLGVGNASTYPSSNPPSVNAIPISTKGFVAAGDVRNYQFWYRDSSSGFCMPSVFNLTNALNVTWNP